MPFGYSGKILRVDLSKAEVSEDVLKAEVLQKFLGGGGIGMKLLYDEMSHEKSALDPKNPLIFMNGPLTGTQAPGSCNYVVISKSPLSGYTGRARANGFFSTELKFAGFDGIVIKGRAEKPSYLWVKDGKSEIRDAADLWGKDTSETEVLIREELSDKKIRVACIGQAGENIARVACIISDRYHAAGRGGLGAVMGSKHLKAIAVRGSKEVAIHNPRKFAELCHKWRKLAVESATGKLLTKWGTAEGSESAEIRNLAGGWPIKNLTTCVFDEWEALTGEYLLDNFQVTKNPPQCFGCPLLHDRQIKIENNGQQRSYAFPEYEDIAAWGSNIGISDPVSIVKLTDLVNRYGIDSVEGGFTISLAMECYEKKLITYKETDVDLTWGNADAVAQLICTMARRQGFGDLLADGVKSAADRIGKGAKEFAVSIKNMAPMQHDLRSDWGLMLGYTVAGAGPVHEGVAKFLLPDPEIGFPQKLHPFKTHRKAEAVKKTQLKRLLSDNLGICNFPARCVPQSLVAEALSAATGWAMNLEELLETSERNLNLIRVFNMKCGLTAKDDWPSPRLLEPPPDGSSKGRNVEPQLRKMIREYYQVMGWDPNSGIPLEGILKKLKLDYLTKDVISISH